VPECVSRILTFSQGIALDSRRARSAPLTPRRPWQHQLRPSASESCFARRLGHFAGTPTCGEGSADQWPISLDEAESAGYGQVADDLPTRSVCFGTPSTLGAAQRPHTLVLMRLSLAVFFYAVTQLLVLVQTISQLGNLIDFQELQPRSSPKPGRGPLTVAAGL